MVAFLLVGLCFPLLQSGVLLAARVDVCHVVGHRECQLTEEGREGFRVISQIRRVLFRKDGSEELNVHCWNRQCWRYVESPSPNDSPDQED